MSSLKDEKIQIKRLKKKDLIFLLEQLETENQALQTKISQLDTAIAHPDLSHLPKGSNQELLQTLTHILNE